MIKISPMEPPCTEANLQQLEQATGWRLPPDYREFLLAYNGGRLEDDAEFRFAQADEGSMLSSFYRVRGKPLSTRLTSQWDSGLAEAI